jgi:hypothetical protein
MHVSEGCVMSVPKRRRSGWRSEVQRGHGPARRPRGRFWRSSRSESAWQISTCSSSMSGCRTSLRNSAVPRSRICPWILNGYAIVYAALLVFFGRLAERHSRNLSFLLGVALFTAASAACALASSVELLVLSRVAQAAGAALMTPTSIGLLLASFPARAARRRGAHLDRDRRPCRGARAARRRRAGYLRLALGSSSSMSRSACSR